MNIYVDDYRQEILYDVIRVITSVPIIISVCVIQRSLYDFRWTRCGIYHIYKLLEETRFIMEITFRCIYGKNRNSISNYNGI